MFQLTRDVRFCIDPLASTQVDGANAFAARPAGGWLSFYMEMGVTLRGELDSNTGFVVNICDIDTAVREKVVPMFADCICNSFGRRRPVGFPVLIELLDLTQRILGPMFGPAMLEQLTLRVTPYRCLTLLLENPAVAFYSEKFEFAAMHKLWNDRLSDTENFDVFGKCANPAGHGHNYVVEVSVQVPREQAFDHCAFEQSVSHHLIDLLDHKSLNQDVAHFKETIPTMENIAKFAWDRLVSELSATPLHEVTVWESDRSRCTYRG